SEVFADAAVVVVTLELSVVPYVKELRTELQAAAAFLAKHEVLVEGEVPVVSAGPAYRVVGCVTPCPSCRRRIVRSIEPFVHRVRIAPRAGYIWTVKSVRNDARHVLTVQSESHWSSGNNADDARDFPSAEGGF